MVGGLAGVELILVRTSMGVGSRERWNSGLGRFRLFCFFFSSLLGWLTVFLQLSGLYCKSFSAPSATVKAVEVRPSRHECRGEGGWRSQQEEVPGPQEYLK